MREIRIILLLIIGLFSAEVTAQTQSEFNSGFNWISLEKAQVEAETSGKKILLFGFAEWCTYCMKMRKETFTDTTVQASLNQYYIPVQLDVESDNEIVYNGKTLKEYELARYLRITSFPTSFFIDSNGEILGAQPGFIESYVYGPLLNYVGSGAFKEVAFEDYFEIEDSGKKE